MNRQYGSRYARGLDVADIAKRIRADIRADQAAGLLAPAKVSVRIDRFAGGKSIDVRIMETEEELLNPAFVQWRHAHPHAYTNADTPHEAREMHSPAGRAMLDRIEAIVSAYNYDGSDTQTDYFDVNFYSSVEFDSDLVDKQRDRILRGGQEVLF